MYISFDIYTGNTGDFFSDSLWHDQKNIFIFLHKFYSSYFALTLTENGGRFCK